MKVLITSGGTKVPIDRVRDITNQSNGTFGSRIAKVCLNRDFQTIFLRAKDSKSPYSLNVDFNVDENIKEKVEELSSFYQNTNSLYSEIEFRNYSDYSSKIEQIVKEQNPDVVVLTAAVSDYGIENFVDSKIRSKENLTLNLCPVPKLISKIKEWNDKVFLVGFKMLVQVSKEELIQSALESIEKNKCDIVVANDWNSFLSGNPEMHIVSKNGQVKTYTKNNAILEEILVDEIIRGGK